MHVGGISVKLLLTLYIDVYIYWLINFSKLQKYIIITELSFLIY